MDGELDQEFWNDSYKEDPEIRELCPGTSSGTSRDFQANIVREIVREPFREPIREPPVNSCHQLPLQDGHGSVQGIVRE